MATASTAKPSHIKVREHRASKQGLRPIQIWVPDVRSPAFRTEADRQSAATAASDHAMDDQAFIGSVTDWGDA